MNLQPDLSQKLEKLNSNIEKQISFKRAMLLALAKGAAGAIGATIITGIIITILIRTVGQVPAVQEFFDNFQEQTQK